MKKILLSLFILALIPTSNSFGVDDLAIPRLYNDDALTESDANDLYCKAADGCAGGAADGAPTQEFFVYPIDPEPTLQLGYYSYCPLAASGGQTHFNFYIPNDYSTLSEVVVVIIADATETVQYDIHLQYAAAGEVYSSSLSSVDVTQDVTINEVEELDVSAVFGNINANDYVGLRFESDTSTLRVVGLRFKYA